MDRKSQLAYQHVFEYVHKNVFTLECSTFTTDYEVAMRNALSIMFEKSIMTACYFHFCQAVKRRAASTYGFVDMVRADKNARSVYYRLHCLPLLPPEYIKTMYMELKAEAVAINKKIFRPFLQYFHKQWIEKVSHGNIPYPIVNE